MAAITKKNNSLKAAYPRYVLVLLCGAIVLIFSVSGLVITQSLRSHALKEIADESKAAIGALSTGLIRELRETQKGAQNLAGSPWVPPVLIRGNPQDIKRVNRVLDRYNRSFDASVCYLLNQQGITVASSNRNTSESFIGKDYSFRPYFQKAIGGKAGSYFALGITSKKRGHYASYPVISGDQKIIGVVVIKDEIDYFADAFRKFKHCYLIDPNGIIFLGSRSHFVLKSLWPVSQKARDELKKTQQFGEGPFEHLLDQEYKDGQKVQFLNQTWLVNRNYINDQGWSVLMLSSTKGARLYGLLGILTTAFIIILLIVFLGILFYMDKSRQKVLESEEKYRELVQNANSIILRLDSEGRIVFINEYAQNFFGYMESEIFGKSVVGTIVPEQDSEGIDVAQVIENLLKDTERYKYNENENIKRNGDRVWVAWTNRVIKNEPAGKNEILCVGTDITQNRRASEHIRRLSTAVEQSPSVIAITDLNGNLEYVNPKFCVSTGYSLEEAKGQNPRILKSGEQPKEVYKDMWEKIAKGEEWRGEFHNKRKDGSLYWELASISPIRNAQGEITHYLKVAEDITERKRAEQMLAETKEALEQQTWGLKKTNETLKLLYKELEEKNAELKKLDRLKSDFVSTVSHELRTPLAITTEGISLVIDQIAGPINDKQRNLLHTSKENLVRLNKIINDLLDISKIESGRLELGKSITDISRIIQKTVNSYQTVADPKKITIRTHFPEERIILFIDQDKIIQALNNLIYNAIKFTKEQGVIDITLASQETEVVISIKDNGVGISHEDMKKLFSKFQQFGRTHGPGAKGTGLGLSITKALVELHGGRIWAESALGEGTTFSFTLPNYKKVIGEFEENLSDDIEEAQQSKKDMTLLLMDVVNYQKIVDRFDEYVLADTMNKIFSIIEQIVSRPKDRALIIDQHTIYISLPQTSKSGGNAVIRRIREEINAQSFMVEKEDVSVYMRFSMAVAPAQGTDRETLIQHARKKLLQPRTVLVVDDHPQIVRILQMRLENKGYQTVPAYNGKEALNEIEKRKPDLIILDIMMPEMNGYEVYGRLKEDPETSDIPVVMLSAHDVDMGKIETFGPKAVPVIQKTGGFENLVSKLEELV